MLVSDIRTAEWGDAVEAIERCYELGWTDGLPVVPPTVERVEKALSYAGRPADEVLGWIPERRREITVEKVAANAVMAGCLPEYLPVVIAATEAMMDVAFNLIAPSSSQGGASILLIVNGPIVEELGINCRNNLFEPGNRANATIGRAIRLILMNAAMLSVDGHQVETATNGRDALDKFIAAPFDLVVTDRAMPEMSGDQLAAALRTVAPGPVIPMTGFGDIMSATGEKPAGVDMILTKPATLNTLREAVAKVISDWDGELGTQPRAPVPSAL